MSVELERIIRAGGSLDFSDRAVRNFIGMALMNYLKMKEQDPSTEPRLIEAAKRLLAKVREAEKLYADQRLRSSGDNSQARDD